MRDSKKIQLFISFDSPPCVAEDFVLKLKFGELAGERYKGKRKVVLTF